VPKASRVAAAIRAAHPAASVGVEELDLSSLASVRAFAAAFAKKHRALHLLVANAGTVFAPLSMSKDGYESAFATNHLGHFLLVGGSLEGVPGADIVATHTPPRRAGGKSAPHLVPHPAIPRQAARGVATAPMPPNIPPCPTFRWTC
jgi:NAD(P)-dependent dehydrogenase (short-subunit alcohol dehydrogenase family)